MADRVAASITIGGSVTGAEFITLCRLIAAEDLSVGEDGDPFSPADRADGFIHLSTAEQLPGTATRHYAGRSDLRLVAVDLAALGDSVRWEPSRGGDLFPHIHGDLPLTAAGPVRGLAVDDKGQPRFADGSTDWPSGKTAR